MTWLRFAMVPEYQLVHVSDAEFERLMEQVEPPAAKLEQIRRTDRGRLEELAVPLPHVAAVVRRDRSCRRGPSVVCRWRRIPPR